MLPVQLEAIGFGEVSDERALQKAVEAICAASEQGVCRPFDGCELTIRDGKDEPSRIEVRISGLLQPLIFGHAQDDGLGHRVSAFTCLDGKPLFPLEFACTSSDEDFVQGELCLAEVSGFAQSISEDHDDMDDVFIAHNGDPGRMVLSGYVTRCEERTNSITGNPVLLTTIYAPGLLIPVCSRTGQQVLPGTKVTASALLAGSLSPRSA